MEAEDTLKHMVENYFERPVIVIRSISMKRH